MNRWLFFLLLFINSTCLLSQTKLKQDTVPIEVRSFNNTALENFKSKRDFQYNRSREPALSLWQKFWNWFWWKIDQILRTKAGRMTFWSVLIILAIFIVVYFVVKITGMSQDGLFGRSSKGLQSYRLSQDNIHHISFEDEIEKALSNGNYRLATRLQYLQALKKLSDKGYIEWRINKTNSDYLTEIAGKSFTDIFAVLTYNFEYTWYGENQVNREQFLEIRRQFQQFNNQVQ